jgi:hypothetical protein
MISATMGAKTGLVAVMLGTGQSKQSFAVHGDTRELLRQLSCSSVHSGFRDYHFFSTAR